MVKIAQHKLELPISEDLYNELNEEAGRTAQPIQVLVHQAIRLWLLKSHSEQREAATRTATPSADGVQDTTWDNWISFCHTFPAAKDVRSYRDLLEERYL